MKVLVAALFCLVLLGCSSEESSWPKRQFSADQWRTSPESERYMFARDLIESQLLVGRPAAEVKAILGAPSSESDADYYFTYVLKTGGDGFNQVYVLDVKLNPATGAVERVTIRGD